MTLRVSLPFFCIYIFWINQKFPECPSIIFFLDAYQPCKLLESPVMLSIWIWICRRKNAKSKEIYLRTCLKIRNPPTSLFIRGLHCFHWHGCWLHIFLNLVFGLFMLRINCQDNHSMVSMGYIIITHRLPFPKWGLHFLLSSWSFYLSLGAAQRVPSKREKNSDCFSFVLL